ncbi:hypothetical protein FOA52_001715 [Chlamydomonas sp. UWO 241]|nr:hypothetical protein FOA52_001715 [Chlamydomonas sp. UWO 241]
MCRPSVHICAFPCRRSTSPLSLMPTMMAAVMACLLPCGATAARELKQTPQTVAPGGAYTAGPACDGQTLHAECPAGQTICDVVTVFYGRSNTVTCELAGNWGAMQYTGCAAKNAAVMTAMDAACLNKASCDVSAIHTAPGVGDPCGGTYKWLAITFNCDAAPTASASPFATVAGFDAPLIAQDSPGNDISRNYGLSLQACADLCSGLSNCVAFDWIASGPSAFYNGVTSPFCIPKYALTSLQAFYSGNVGALYKKAAAPAPAPVPTPTPAPASTIVAAGGAYTAGPACDGQTLHAECPTGQTISDVVTVFYGRSNSVTCPLAGNTGAMQNTGCAANDAAIMTAVDAACLNKASCDVSAIHTAPGVGDPCGGTYKWLAITFNCAAAPTASPFATVAGFDAPLIAQDSPGNDISRNYGTSLQACADLCSGLSNCVAFDWIASGPSAVHNGVPSPFCIPKYALTSLQAFYSGNVGALYKKAAVVAPALSQSSGVACEGSTLALSCASGTIASINAAFYGRDDTTTCQLAGNWGASQYIGCAANAATVSFYMYAPGGPRDVNFQQYTVGPEQEGRLQALGAKLIPRALWWQHPNYKGRTQMPLYHVHYRQEMQQVAHPEQDLGFLYEDHQVLHQLEEGLTGAMEALLRDKGEPGQGAKVALVRAALQMDSALITHLGEEEEVVVPLTLLK